MPLDPARKPDLQLLPNDLTAFDQAVADFLRAKSGKAQKTIYFYETSLYQFRAFTDPTPWPPSPESIDGFLNHCKGRGLKESSVEAYYKALKIWLAWLVKRGRLDRNPMELAEKPPQPKLLPRVPRHRELTKLFGYLERAADRGKGEWLAVRDLALWSLALDTGLRVGELAALTTADITLKKGHGTAFVDGGKTHQDRVVVFDRQTAKEIRRWLKARSRLPLPPDIDALFVAHTRGKWGGLTTWGIRQDLAAHCKKAGIPHLTPHRFRNAYAVETLRNGGDVLDVQKQLGHRRLSTTERYLLVDDEGRVQRHKGTTPRGKL